MNPEENLRKLGLELPTPAKPLGAYVAAVRSGNLVFTAGQVPLKDGQLLAKGKVPTDVPLDVAEASAMQAALNGLAAVRAALGEGATLARVVRVVRLNVFVNSAPGFTGQAGVANAASELMVLAFGEAGRHTRCAVGAAELPLNAPVEIDLVVEVM
jgi:enamine deaminase RidA (YjgF/YER057c/UK114 family)